jgi:hypothetical protein
VKIRQRRKLVQASIRRNNTWNWNFDRFVRAVAEAYNRFDKHIEEAMGAVQEGHTITKVGPYETIG